MNHDRIPKFSEHYFACYEKYVKKIKMKKTSFFNESFLQPETLMRQPLRKIKDND